jgi:hypothetical protein
MAPKRRRPTQYLLSPHDASWRPLTLPASQGGEVRSNVDEELSDMEKMCGHTFVGPLCSDLDATEWYTTGASLHLHVCLYSHILIFL